MRFARRHSRRICELPHGPRAGPHTGVSSPARCNLALASCRSGLDPLARLAPPRQLACYETGHACRCSMSFRCSMSLHWFNASRMRDAPERYSAPRANPGLPFVLNKSKEPI